MNQYIPVSDHRVLLNNYAQAISAANFAADCNVTNDWAYDHAEYLLQCLQNQLKSKRNTDRNAVAKKLHLPIKEVEQKIDKDRTVHYGNVQASPDTILNEGTQGSVRVVVSGAWEQGNVAGTSLHFLCSTSKAGEHLARALHHDVIQVTRYDSDSEDVDYLWTNESLMDVLKISDEEQKYLLGKN